MNNSERWHHQPALYMGAFSAMAERGEHIVVPVVPGSETPRGAATAVRSHADEDARASRREPGGVEHAWHEGAGA